MQFIDTHCHIIDEAFSPEDWPAYIENAKAASVGRMIQADIDSKERQRMFDLVAMYPKTLYPMLGLYPGSVGRDWKSELDEVERWSRRTDIAQIVAIGEIGLDYHYGDEFRREQKDALYAQLHLAARLDLPVNIHLRDATEDFFDVMDSCRQLGLRGNLHAFSGSAETAARMMKYGDWSFGIGGVLTFKKAGIATSLEQIPIERILLETDAPYLAPTPLRGTRNESANIPIIARKVAQIKGMSLEDVASATSANALRLFTRIAE